MSLSAIFARSYWVFSAALPALLACTGTVESHAGRGAATELRSLAATAPGLTLDAGAKVLSAQTSGSCSFDATVADDYVELGNSTILSDAPCGLHIELEVPEGYQVSLPSIALNGPSPELEPGATITVRERYGSAPFSELSYPLYETLQRPENASKPGWYWLARTSEPVWSDSCVSQRVSYDLELGGSGLRFVELSLVDVFFSYRRGLSFKRCGGDEVAPPASGVGELCGGAHDHPCTAALVCDRLQTEPDAANPGTCRDPSEPPAPVPFGQLCGGPLATPCALGLTCSYTLPELENDPRVYGKCFRNPSSADEPCEGYPAIGCAAGLMCWRSGLQVEPRQAWGECKARVSEHVGERCGGAPSIACAASLQCVDSVCVATDGSVGSRCSASGPFCQSDLSCHNAVCRNWSAWPEAADGEACGYKVQRRCAGRAMCNARNVCEAAMSELD